jgi:hypothetical protein
MIRIDPFGSCFEIRFLESSEKPSSHVLSKEGVKETDLAIRSVVVRIYRDWEKEPTTYEKLTCPVTDDRISIGGGDYPNTGIGMMAGEDQTDPALRDLMSEFIIVWRLNDQPDTLSNFKEWKKGREDPAGYAFGWQSSPQPMLVTFTDAVGNPLSGATASYYTGNSESDSLLQKSVLDQAGQMVIPLHGGSDTSAYSFLVACSKYETAGIRPSHRRSRIYRLPIVRKGTLEWDRSIRGTVIDPEGKAVVEARVSCRISGPGFSPDRWFVMTDGQGRFVYYPPMATTRTEDKQTGYFDPSLSAPDITVEPPRSSGLLNFGNRVPAGGEIKIALERGQRYHTFAFEDVSGRLVNAGYVGVRKVFVQPNHYVLSVADLLKGGTFPDGRYEVAPSNDVLYDDLEVTADSPEQLVFRPMPERVFSGHVLDATTGKTLEDVFIAISDSGQSDPDFTLLSSADLRTIRNIVPPSGQSQQIPPTYPFSLQFKELVRTDPQGSFTVKVKRGRDANGLVFFKENYKPLVSRALFGVRVDISSGRKSRKMHESNLEVKLMPLQNR